MPSIQTPDEQAFSAMKAALNCGANLWNSSEFYGESDAPNRRTDNLSLINRYFTKYPEDADKVVLSMKGGADMTTFTPDGSPQGIKRSVENILHFLDGKKRIDIFECARVDKKVPIETTIAAIAEYVKAGKIGGIGLSEVGENTIRRAHAVHPIAAVEVEFSLWSTDILHNGVASTCAELGIPIVGYSPLGHGFLTGQIRSNDDIPHGDLRKYLDRFQPGNLEKNLDLVNAIHKIASVIIPTFGAVKDSRVVENMTKVEVTDEEMTEIDEVLKGIKIMGTRYTEAAEGDLFA